MISLVPNLSQVASMTILRSAGALEFESNFIYAYRAGYQAVELPFIANMMMYKAREYKKLCVMASNDVPQAYDNALQLYRGGLALARH